MSSTLGDCIGGMHLYSPALKLLNAVDFLAFLGGMGGEVEEG